MKKRFQFLVLLLSLVFVAGCSDDYNDSYLREQIENLQTDVAALQKQLSSIQTVVDALEKGKTITNIQELTDESGYTLSFSDGQTISIKHGKAGKDALVLGVAEEEGIYYWTLSLLDETQFLTDQAGNKLPVSGKNGTDGTDGTDGLTPQLGIDSEGYWVVNKERIKDELGEFVAAQGDSFFQAIEDKDEEVVFTLANGKEIRIPKAIESFLRFDDNKSLGVDEEGNPVLKIMAGRPNKLALNCSPNIKNIEVLTEFDSEWTAVFHRGNKTIDITPPRSVKFYTGLLKIQGVDDKGLIYQASAAILIQAKDYDDPKGVFVLNEGNMTTENGSLIYISPEGEVRERVYFNSNGVELGNVTQDLFIHQGKIYIIAQNGNTNAVGDQFTNEGKLVIADLKTLKKEVSFNDELETLFWPSHIAVLNESNILIRDNKGIYRFNKNTQELQFIANSAGAIKNRMAVASKRVFAAAAKDLLVIEADQDEVSKHIEMPGTITGLIRSKDGHILVSTVGEKQLITKLNSETLEVMQTNEVSIGKLGAGFGATPGISAFENIIYYSNAATKIHRHDFVSGVSSFCLDVKDFIPDANMVYNNLGVHPVTGEVYMNTIKGYGWNFLINDISVYAPQGETLNFKTTYKNHTHFPAGFFFMGNFPEPLAAQ